MMTTQADCLSPCAQALTKTSVHDKDPIFIFRKSRPLCAGGVETKYIRMHPKVLEFSFIYFKETRKIKNVTDQTRVKS